MQMAIILPYIVVDMRWHTGEDYQVLFATNERDEAITAARESGGGSTVIYSDEKDELVIFINDYQNDVGLSS